MKHIIVVDVGGTNCRFGLFLLNQLNDLEFIKDKWLTTNGFESFDAIFEHLAESNFFPSYPYKQKFIIAVPGPVLGERLISMINVKWTIDTISIKDKYPQYDFFFLNDLLAQAFGFLTKAGQENLRRIKNGLDFEKGDIAVVGAGTGIGHSCLKRFENDYIPLPSEAGHTTFSFINEEEEKYRRFIYNETGEMFPTLNAIVSGSGLMYLHKYLTGKTMLPEEIIKNISANSDTTEWFSRFYARCCKNYCLTVLSGNGTLYITGGIATDNPFLIDNDIFRKEFITSSLTSNLLQNIPIYINGNKNIGLWGAACYSMRKNK